MQRGYLKITVLKILSDESMSGYDLMKKISRTVGVKPSPGSLYPLLKDLKSKKMIHAKNENRKIIYSITKKGGKLLEDIKEKHQGILKFMERNVNFMDKIICDKNKGVIKIFKRLVRGEAPFSVFTHDMVILRDTMLDVSGKRLTETQKKKILSTIKKATQEVKKYAKRSN